MSGVERELMGTLNSDAGLGSAQPAFRYRFGGFVRYRTYFLIAYDCVQSKDSFYIDFVLQSIIKMFVLFWVWHGVGWLSPFGLGTALLVGYGFQLWIEF